MEYTKVSATEMEQTITKPAEVIKVTHDYDDLIKRRAEAQEQADMYASIVKDFDALIAQMDKLGCKPTEEKVEAVDIQQ